HESSLNKKNSYLLTKSIIGKTAANKKVIHIKNFKTSNENLIQYGSNEHNNIGSIICAPILVNDSVLGVLELTHPDVEHFNAWQEHSLAIYADLIGMLLNNTELLSNMKSAVDARTEELRHSLEESEKMRVRYEEMSVIDHLTKIYNRRYLFTEVASSLARAKRYNQPFSLLLMDLDHFKQVNDIFGHECGDKVLINVAKILSEFTREGDTLARIGGEEFVLALPETNGEGAIKLAERIRKTIEDYAWECNEKPMDIKISIGLATLEDCNDDEIHEENIQVSDMLRKADLALYYVKRHGRNSVKSFSEIP
ncbi:MAG: sensor domain-containing diguanylate cyclase, partial [Gammaproteobacteria bacterium]